MTSDDPQPDSPYLVLGLFLDQLSDEQALARTCAVLREHNASCTGTAWLGPADPPPFEYVSDLPVKRAPWPSNDPGLRPYRVGMSLDGLGTVAVSFGRAEPEGGHPVEVLATIGPYGYGTDLWNAEDRATAPRYRATVLATLRALCESMDPLYASAEEEEATVTPSRLVGGDAVLPGDFFVSHRVLQRAGAITELFPDAVVTSWKTGVIVSHWLASADMLSPPEDVLRTASRELGRVAAEIGWVSRRSDG